MATPMAPATLDVNPDWGALLSQLTPTINLQNPQIQYQLVFSLLVFLRLSLQEFLAFLFESTIPAVKHRAGMFIGYSKSNRFAPERIFCAWHGCFPKSIPYLCHESPGFYFFARRVLAARDMKYRSGCKPDQGLNHWIQ
jgi:hypothetical protein